MTMVNIEWLGHASFRITGEGKTIYIDPWKLKAGQPKADLILISHSHYDHLSAEDVAKIGNPTETQILCTPDCAAALHGWKLRTVQPDETIHIGTLVIRTVPAYNPNKQFHPRDNHWVGFLIILGGEAIYYSGDTDIIPEMSTLGKVDVALLPVGGTYTMTANEAAEAVRIIKPARAIPYHWGDIVGTEKDAEKFKKLCAVQVEVKYPEAA
jgi:L-ascorbate metabolism protein UlaG (beta-lactamase superfamily)